MFTARVGESVMAYVRRQRMLLAAARLGDNPGAAVDTDAPALIDLASIAASNPRKPSPRPSSRSSA